MRIRLLSTLLLLAVAAEAEPRVRYFSIGPMLHWNFSRGDFRFASYGLEAAWWSYSYGGEGLLGGPAPLIEEFDRPGYGLAAGFDAGRGSCRWYVEPEIGWGLGGFSLGPVVELPYSGVATRWGIQGSAWANFILGADLRYRRLGGEGYLAPGAYAKAVGLLSNGEGE